MDKKQTSEALKRFFDVNQVSIDKVAKENPELDNALKGLLMAIDKEYGDGNFVIPQAVEPSQPQNRIEGLLSWLEVTVVEDIAKKNIEDRGERLNDVRYDDLPNELFLQALSEQQRQGNALNGNIKLVANRNVGGFDWNNTIFSMDFWLEVAQINLKQFYFEPLFWQEFRNWYDITIKKIVPSKFSILLEQFIRAKNFQKIGDLYPRMRLNFLDLAKKEKQDENTPLREFYKNVTVGDVNSILLKGFENYYNDNLWNEEKFWLIGSVEQPVQQATYTYYTFDEAELLEENLKLLAKNQEIKIIDLPKSLQALAFKENSWMPIGKYLNYSFGNEFLNLTVSNSIMWDLTTQGQKFWSDISKGYIMRYLYEPSLFHQTKEKQISTPTTVADLPPRIKELYRSSIASETVSMVDRRFYLLDDFVLKDLPTEIVNRNQFVFGNIVDNNLLNMVENFYIYAELWATMTNMQPSPQTVSTTSTSNKERVKGATADKPKKKTATTTKSKTAKTSTNKTSIPDPPAYKDANSMYDDILMRLNSEFDKGLTGKSAQPKMKKGQILPKYSVGRDGNIYYFDGMNWIQMDDYDEISKVKEKDKMLILVARSVADMMEAKNDGDKGLWEIYKEDYEVRKDYYENMR